jgi:hypothetical protein
MKFPFVRSLLATLFLAAGVAHAAADEAKVKKNLELPQRPRRRQRQEDLRRLFEVVLKSGELLYTDAT